jgi:hypothetical protein
MTWDRPNIGPDQETEANSMPKIAGYAPLPSYAYEYSIVRSYQISTHFYAVRHLMAAAKKNPSKITVLLSDEEFERFDGYCRDRGFKKSTLIARLVRQFLDLEGYGYAPGQGGQRPQPGRFGR